MLSLLVSLDKRACARWLAALGLALCAACSVDAAPEELPPKEAGELSVLTFNVFGFPLLERLQRPGRFAQLEHELSSSLASLDLVLLQEAFVPSTRVLRAARRHAIAGACGEDPSFNPTGLLLLTDHEPLSAPRRFAFLKDERGRWQLEEERALDCRGLRGARKANKGVMMVTVSTPEGPVDVVNVHLATRERDRAAQKRLLEELLHAREGTRPVILGGDLNEDTCKGEEEARPSFPGELALTDASCGVGPTVGGLRWGLLQGAFFAGEIDHIYVEGASPTDKRRRLFSKPRRGGHLSDHDGVLALVRLTAG